MSGDFYLSGLGDRLVEPALLPPVIQEHLRSEQSLLDRLDVDVDGLVEVGSMHGLHRDWATGRDMSYLGLDVVQRYVEVGNTRISMDGLPADRCRLVLAGAEELARMELPASRVLVLYPFNSFGNIPNPTAATEALADSGLPFMISSYQTGSEAIAAREEYYVACGCSNVRHRVGDDGVRFSADGGLDTIAYHPSYLLDLLGHAGIAATAVAFGPIGMAYLSAPHSA